MSEDFIEVPITVGFDKTRVVGMARLLKTCIPEDPTWCLSLGYKVDTTGKGYDLKELTILQDIKP